MSIGFVYILINPAFAKHVKIGRTARDPQKRASELSRQTGVPDDFIVLYDVLVADAPRVESLLHERFAQYRHRRNKEFFCLPPKDAIIALQEIAAGFPVPPNAQVLSVDLLPHFRKSFAKYLDSAIVGLELQQMSGVCFLEIKRQPAADQPVITTQDSIPLEGLREPQDPTVDDLRHNEALLQKCEPYDWVMISEVFPEQTARAIAEEWEASRRQRLGDGSGGKPE